MTLKRILFLAILGVLALLVAGMLVLSTGSSVGPEGLAVLAQTLIGVGVVVVIIELWRRWLRRQS